MEQNDKLLVETAERAKSNTHRIDALEEDAEALHKLATSVELLAQNMKRMTDEQEKQGKRLEALERQPAERWNNMTRTIFTSLVSTLAGGLVGALAALLLR